MKMDYNALEALIFEMQLRLARDLSADEYSTLALVYNILSTKQLDSFCIDQI